MCIKSVHQKCWSAWEGFWKQQLPWPKWADLNVPYSEFRLKEREVHHYKRKGYAGFVTQL